MTEIVGKMKIMEKRKIKSAEFRNYTHCSQKCFVGWVGFQNYYILLRVGHGKCLRPITRWMGEVKKGQNHAYVIFEWSLYRNPKLFFSKNSLNVTNVKPLSKKKLIFFWGFDAFLFWTFDLK